MTLERKIELLHRSSSRLIAALQLSRDSHFWRFVTREIVVHFCRTVELAWAVLRRKNGKK